MPSTLPTNDQKVITQGTPPGSVPDGHDTARATFNSIWAASSAFILVVLQAFPSMNFGPYWNPIIAIACPAIVAIIKQVATNTQRQVVVDVKTTPTK